MGQTAFRLILGCVAALLLGSCSYVYDLRAVAIDGRLAFIVDPNSRRQPDCVDMIDVSVDKGGPLARPAKGDDERLVRNGGVYWWKSFETSSCPMKFPIRYGQQVKGVPFVYGNEGPSNVEAKPLRLGVVYEVMTSGGSGSGGAWFRITQDRRIENLREDPTPAVTNTDGYDVTDYANMAEAPDQGSYYPQP